MKFTNLAQIETAIGTTLERVSNGIYNVPNWPTSAMNRKDLLKWANGLGEAIVALSPVQRAKMAYRKVATARAQAQGDALGRLLFA